MAGPSIGAQFEPQPGDAEPDAVFVPDREDRPAPDPVPHRLHHRGDAARPAGGHPALTLYSGQIEGVGPRYCPSIEDKIVKFPDKLRHQIFLEPEGLDTNEVYVNGMSTSMPIDVQAAMLASIPGLEQARDDPARVRDRIRCDRSAGTGPYSGGEVDPGLYLAGQINGTSGYEEAGCQG